MTISDFFSFDKYEYAQRISHYDSERLCKQEIVKTRQAYSGSCTVGAGIGGAAFTFGASLAGSAYGARRVYVAIKKLKLIKAELTSRNVPLHKLQKRDILIPLGAGLVGAGVGLGFSELAAVATNTIPMGIHMPSGTTAVQQMIHDPGDVFNGAVNGISEQVHELGGAMHGISDGVMPGSEDCATALASHTLWQPAGNAAEFIGYYQGMLMAQGVEKTVASTVGAQSAWLIMESCLGMDKAREKLLCARMIGMPMHCDGCSEKIDGGCYWHCCACDHNFDLCKKCYIDGKRCQGAKGIKTHKMVLLQVTKNCDFMLKSSNPRYESSKVNSNWSVEKTALKDKQCALFSCNSCGENVTQGVWLFCRDCPEFDLCSTCWTRGEHCSGSNHALESGLACLDCIDNPRCVKDCRRYNTGVRNISCSNCEVANPQGRFYHCCNCDNDNFDLCHACYKSGITCNQPKSHVLQTHLLSNSTSMHAYPATCKRKLADPKSMKLNGTCSLCREQIGGFFYHCCSCDKDDFDMCTDCYRKGQGCEDLSHHLKLFCTE